MFSKEMMIRQKIRKKKDLDKKSISQREGWLFEGLYTVTFSNPTGLFSYFRRSECEENCIWRSKGKNNIKRVRATFLYTDYETESR